MGEGGHSVTDLRDQWHLLQNPVQIRYAPAFRVPDVCRSRAIYLRRFQLLDGTATAQLNVRSGTRRWQSRDMLIACVKEVVVCAVDYERLLADIA